MGDEATRFRCEDCRVEFLNLMRLSEHRNFCTGGCSTQSSASRPNPSQTIPAGASDTQTDPLEVVLAQSLLSEVDAATQRKRHAFELAARLATETRRHTEELNQILLEKDSCKAALMEASGRLKVAIESKASKSERFMYETRMNHASEALELLTRRENIVHIARQKAIVEYAAAMEKLLEAMSIERSTFKFAVSLMSLQAESTQSAQVGQTEGFSEK